MNRSYSKGATLVLQRWGRGFSMFLRTGVPASNPLARSSFLAYNTRYPGTGDDQPHKSTFQILGRDASATKNLGQTDQPYDIMLTLPVFMVY
jgi:hypothetical protein